MKKMTIFYALTTAVAFSCASASWAQPPMNEQINDAEKNARNAEVNRELVPRSDKMGLLICFHGAGSPKWNDLTDSIVAKVRDINDKEKKFFAIEGANMEFTFHGDAVDGVETLEKAGCDLIVVVPAFIFPTSHVQFDVVSVLGLYGEASRRADLREEGIRTVRTKLPIVMAGVLADGDLVKEYVVDQAKSISKEPKDERLLIVAHGDEDYRGLVEHLTEPAVNAAKELGFDKVETAWVEMGQSFGKNAKPIVQENTKEGKRTLIIAVYLASAGKGFVERIAKWQEDASLEGLDWVGNETPIGEFEKTPAHIYELGVAASLY